jgi:predicted transcriptional regulator
MTTATIDANRLIELFGGPTAIATELDISPQAVSMWRNTGVPDSRLKYFNLKDAGKYSQARTTIAQAATESVAVQGVANV